MKKLLLPLLLSVTSIGFSQQRVANGQISAPVDHVEKTQFTVNPEQKKRTLNTKAFRDTLYYEDFDGGLPAGWTIVNNNANNFQWLWDTVAKNGVSTNGLNHILSTTNANGFMSLPSDFYNTPRPVTGSVAMDTYFESDSIFINPQNSVWVSYQQYLVYCCSGANRLVLQVSTDNFANFTEYDATDDLPVNFLNVANSVATADNIINISTAVAGASSFKIRFLAFGNTTYIWYIDDFAVIEGPANDIELRDPYMEFNEANYDFYPFYGQIPYDLFTPLPLFGRIYNNGGNASTNTRLEATITHTSFPGGAPGSGAGVIYTSSMNTNPSTIPSAGVMDTSYDVLTGLPRFVPLILGNHQVDILATSDSLDQFTGNEDQTFTFATSDTVFARDDNGFGGPTSPADYVSNNVPGGTAVGDRFGTMYIIESRTGGNQITKKPTSVTFRVSDNTSNIGVEIVPKIWEYDEDSLFINGTNFSIDRAFGAEVASRFVPYTVTAADTSSFLTVSFDNGTGFMNGLDSGQYVVGWEVTSIAGNTNFEVLNDGSSTAFQANVTSFNYHGHAPGWGWVDVNPGIRLNLGDLPVSTGLNDNGLSSTSFDVLPNPNNGEFTVKIATATQVTYNLNVRNMLGQTVYTDVINVNGQLNERLDLTQYEKGVYFVSLENDSDKILKKVVIK